MRLVVLLILLLLHIEAQESFGQGNLVPNPSFENYSSCPTAGNQVYKATGWINCGETPDYQNACSGGPGAIGVPYNVFGYQPAATGNAYCDVATYSINGLYREFIGTWLTQPMIVGQTYFVSFKCAPGSPGNGYCIQTDKLGIRFSTVAYDSLNSSPIDNFAHVYSTAIVTDTVGWTTISGYVTADTAYSFITIGNFFDDVNTDTIKPDSCNFGVYYVDDVAVLDSFTSVHEHTGIAFPVSFYLNGKTLFLESMDEPLISVLLFDLTGRLIFSKKAIRNRKVSVDLSYVQNGLYLVIAETVNNSRKIKFLTY